MRSTLLGVILAAAAVAAAQEETVQVELQQGVIEGARSEIAEGRFVYSFLTIPFAEPPVGDLRFKNPVPAAPWSGVRNGSLPTPMCPQLFTLVEAKLQGQEDCLFLNVHTPRPHEADLPVMVWIHGGGFTIGNSAFYGPAPLLTKDVVLVVIQYRLSTLGFLTTGDDEIPGNLGLKDQTMALRWVQDNIRAFGGDPGKVTIFGESAGAASTHFHVLSPMSAGLFQRAIMQSGTALDPWAVREDHSDVATRFGEMFNCSGSSPLTSSELVACLREVPAADLIEAPNKFKVFVDFPSVMAPSVDGEFLPDHPARLLRDGRYNKVDVITGTTQHEGQSIVGMMAGNETLASLAKNFSANGPVMAYFEPEEDREYLARRFFHHYLGPLEDLAGKSDAMQEVRHFWRNMPLKTNKLLDPERFSSSSFTLYCKIHWLKRIILKSQIRASITSSYSIIKVVYLYNVTADLCTIFVHHLHQSDIPYSHSLVSNTLTSSVVANTIYVSSVSLRDFLALHQGKMSGIKVQKLDRLGPGALRTSVAPAPSNTFLRPCYRRPLAR
nr:acetylcholinesterase-like [Penaeus vannamei]